MSDLQKTAKIAELPPGDGKFLRSIAGTFILPEMINVE